MINCIGSMFGTSGYDIHFRELVNALSQLTEVKLSTGLPDNWSNLVNDRELQMIKRKGEADINLIITNPINWRLHTNAKRNWVYLIFEGDRIPDSFVNECLNEDIEYIFVPSEHTKNAIYQTIYDIKDASKITDILDNKIKIIPHGVCLNKFYLIEKDLNTNST